MVSGDKLTLDLLTNCVVYFRFVAFSFKPSQTEIKGILGTRVISIFCEPLVTICCQKGQTQKCPKALMDANDNPLLCGLQNSRLQPSPSWKPGKKCDKMQGKVYLFFSCTNFWHPHQFSSNVHLLCSLFHVMQTCKFSEFSRKFVLTAAVFSVNSCISKQLLLRPVSPLKH